MLNATPTNINKGETKMTCVACSGSLKPSSVLGLISGRPVNVNVCRTCGGLHFSGYKGDAYDVLRINRLQADSAVATSLYFDFELCGSKGIERIHGWFDPSTRTPVQFG